MKCANCGLEIKPYNGYYYGEKYRHTNGQKGTCVYANNLYKNSFDMDWSKQGKYCNYEGLPYIASLTKGEVATLHNKSENGFKFVPPFGQDYLNLAPWDK